MRIGIIGAGISGCYAAHLLSREGFEVVLFDPKAPWEKPCGGGIPERTFHLFPVLTGFREACRPVRRVRMYSWNGEVCEVRLPDPIRLCSRRTLGRFLLDRAESSGTDFLGERVRGVAFDHGTWKVTAGAKSYRFDFLIGADGMQSLVRRKVVGRIGKRDTTLTVGYWVDRDFEDEVAIAFVRGISGYIWIFPRNDHLSVGIGARAGETTGRRLYEFLDDFLRRHYPGLLSGKRTRYGALIPSLTPKGFSSNRVCGESWALLGDAAGWADPVTGEGIHYAFCSAELFARAFTSGNVTDYEKLCGRQIVPELRHGASYSRTFYDPAVSARLVTLAREKKSIQTLLAKLLAGEQGYGTLKKELLKTFPSVTRDLLFRIFR